MREWQADDITEVADVPLPDEPAVSSAACRDLDEVLRLAEVRLLVVDDHGQVLGAGKRTRVPPDRLAEAVRTMFRASIAPNTRTSARHCDSDFVNREVRTGFTKRPVADEVATQGGSSS